MSTSSPSTPPHLDSQAAHSEKEAGLQDDRLDKTHSRASGSAHRSFAKDCRCGHCIANHGKGPEHRAGEIAVDHLRVLSELGMPLVVSGADSGPVQSQVHLHNRLRLHGSVRTWMWVRTRRDHIVRSIATRHSRHRCRGVHSRRSKSRREGRWSSINLDHALHGS
ncbi:hypothetical protein FKP32DRAFT_1430728 [Trametes sanguinea]|nr:hypothetical protein FKP32DRAFT_1430728 [Trametes sanguinea]